MICNVQAPDATPESPSERSPRPPTALDLFRAVVCLQIVGMHTYFGATHAVMSSHLGPFATWIVANLRFGYESFFVIAGFFLAHNFRPGRWSHFSVARFFSRRIVRLAVPYWIALALGVIGLLIRHYSTGAPSGVPSFGEMIPVFLFAHNFGSAWSPSTAHWFMAVLIQLYLTWCLLFWLIRRCFLWQGDNDYHNRSVTALQVLTVLVFGASLAAHVAGAARPGSVVYSTVFFAIGCLAYWQATDRSVKTALGMGIVLLLAFGALTESSRLVAAGIAAGVLPFLAGRAAPDFVLTRALATVGTWSYSIYLTHMYVAPRVLYLATSGGEPTFALALAAYGLAIAAAVAAGFLFYRAVERPLASLSREIAYRGPDQPAPAASSVRREYIPPRAARL